MSVKNVKRNKRKPIAEMNVVPYIDVMLVLLVIFMVTAPLLSQGVKVELPKTSSDPIPNQDQEPLILTVDRAGQYYLNVGGDPETPIDSATLVARVTAVLRRVPGKPVYVRGDAKGEYGNVVVAMTLLQKGGAPSVGLLTDPVETKKRTRK